MAWRVLTQHGALGNEIKITLNQIKYSTRIHCVNVRTVRQSLGYKTFGEYWNLADFKQRMMQQIAKLSQVCKGEK